MGWFSILKVDIKTSRGISSMGQYDHEKEEITLNPYRIAMVYKKAKGRGKRRGKPLTEEEMAQAFMRVAMHEAGHAAHHQADPESYNNPKMIDDYGMEMIAYLTEFPESVYIAYKQSLMHPAALMAGTEALARYGVIVYGDTAEDNNKLIEWVDEHAKKSADKEKLIRLELSKRKSTHKRMKKYLPPNLYRAVLKYGEENRKFLETLEWEEGEEMYSKDERESFTDWATRGL